MGLALIPVGVLSGLWLWPRSQTAAAFAATFGILAGLVQALGIAGGMAEPFGLPMAGAINAISYTLWALWLVVLGVVVIRARAD